MPNFYSSLKPPEEPRNRFYPVQDALPSQEPRIPSAPNPSTADHAAQLRQIPPAAQRQPAVQGQSAPQKASRHSSTQMRCGNDLYFEQRHPLLLRRLLLAATTFLDAYPAHDFIYDAYPDYLSLRLMRDRLLKENQTLTEEFLQAGCPMEWLSLLTDSILSELLCKKRRSVCSLPVQPPFSETYRKPMGDANTTSV